jgi:phospholipase/lecithinase/hemolysin
MRKSCAFLLLFVLCAASAAWAGPFISPPLAGPYTNLFVFGDSLCDPGNAAYGSGGAYPNPAYYPDGLHFSNGPTWVEQLAPMLGLPSLKRIVDGGTDYAVGGAETGAGLSSVHVTPNLAKQMTDYYLPAHPSATATDLFVIWGGAMDIFDGKTDMASSAQNIADQVQTLYDTGARRFLVPNLPPLDKTPDPDLHNNAGVAALTSWFNAELAGRLNNLQANDPGITISQFDTYSFFNDVLADPGKYGLVNVTSPALFAPANAGTSLFWDTVHPTTYAHGILAAEAVPEPSTLALLGVTVTGLLAYGWGRWKRAI